MTKNTARLLLVILFYSAPVFSQPISDLYLKVEKKLVQDKNYLDLYAVNFTPEDNDVNFLSNVPRTADRSPFTFRKKDGVNYQIVFKKETLELDSVTILYIKEIEDKQSSGESFFGDASQGPQIDTLIVLTFGDVQELFDNSPDIYQYLYDITKKFMRRDEAFSLLKLVIDEKANKSKGISFIDNRDFLSYKRMNSIHLYPKDPDESTTQRRSRRSGGDAAPEDFQIDASFSHVSFFHNYMNLGFSTISAEINTGTRVLNLQPYQSMGLTFGMRTLFSLKGNLANLKNEFVIDAKIMGRARLNTSNLSSSLPFLFVQKPTLNVGPGLILDISTSRYQGFPFMNFYFSTASSSPENPYVKFGPPDSSTAYFTFHQWETTFSFFWNSSEDRTVRFKMDIGAANYDVYKATYKPETRKALLYNKIQPVVSLSTTFAPQNSEFLSAQLKYYDGVINLFLWMKILEIQGVGGFRFETSFFSSPMFRTLYEWETEGSNSMVQIRYRYGF